MPVVAKDAAGNLQKHDILGGRAQVLMFENRPSSWYYKQRIPHKRVGSKYVTRCLEEADLARAILKGEDLYLALQMEIEGEKEPLKSLPIERLLKDWIKLTEERQAAGQISEATVRGKTSAMLGAIRLYLTKHKKLSLISQIRKDTFLDYSSWRVKEGWKLISNFQGSTPPKDQTIKRDLVQVKDWFQNFLIPRGYTEVMPSFEKINIHQDKLDANPPIPLEPDWRHIYTHLDTWANDADKVTNGNHLRIAYWRQLFRHFVLVAYNTGCRPSELLGKLEKQRKQNKDGTYIIKEVLKGGLRWEDVEVETAIHTAESGKEFEFEEAFLYIRYSKTGIPREVPSNTGKFFIRWRKYCDQYRKQIGLKALTKRDFVFFNPHTNKPYSYSMVCKAWNDMRTELSLLLSPVRTNQKYTLYSLRSSYITNQIEEGKDIYLIKKITGHSLEILNRHYDRSDVKKRRAEATARTYSKKAAAKNIIDLEKLN